MHYQQGIDRNQLYMLSLSETIAPDAFVRIIDLLVDVLPLEEFGFTNTKLNKEGNIPYHPKDLFKLLLYGYRYNLRSGSKLSKACTINLEVIWLVNGLRPSPRTINYFRANNAKAIIKANQRFVQLLKNWNMIGGDTLAVDSTKIRGQNSLKNNYNIKKVNRHIEYLEDKIDNINKSLDTLHEKNSNKRNLTDEEIGLSDKLEEAHDRLQAYHKLKEEVKKSEDGQISTTDPESKAVLSKRNIVKVGYSIQVTSDAKHKMIIDVFQGGVNDINDYGKAAKRAQQILAEKHFDLLADAGYHNGAELAYAERLGVKPYVAPRRQKEQKAEGYRKSDFKYNYKTDSYTCPANEQLEYICTFEKGTLKRPYKAKRYGTHNCANCPLKDECTENKRGRFIERPAHQAHVDRNYNRVTKRKEYYRQRQAIIEHIFGTWKRHWGLPHAHLKSKEKVLCEYNLAALLYNLQRIVSIEGYEKVKMRLKMLHFAFIQHIRLHLRSEQAFLRFSFIFIYRVFSNFWRPRVADVR